MISIYTDGGCSGNPGPGAWAYVIISIANFVGIANKVGAANEVGDTNEVGDALPLEDSGAEVSTTNNRMELQAVIAALERVSLGNSPPEAMTVYTDSQYVQRGMTVWMKDWKARGWKTSGREQVKNQDLWRRLDTLAQGLPVNWVWVKGHAGDKYNERCDILVKKAIASL